MCAKCKTQCNLFALLINCFLTHPKSKLPLSLAPFLMLRLQYATLYLLTYVILNLFIHSPLNSKPTFPTLIHSLIHTDFTVNDWHRFEPRPYLPWWCIDRPVILGGVTGTVFDREPDVWKPHFHFIFMTAVV